MTNKFDWSNTKITVTKLTDKSLLDKACSFTVDKEVDVKNMKKMYESEHSPIRTQMFWIEVYNIPTFVSVHLVRHKHGVEHYVKSLREDRCGDGTEDRWTPTNHAMWCNAQALINMSRKRLCSQASHETIKVMQMIREKVQQVDDALAQCMVPDCVYKNGKCTEFKSCGRWN